MKTKILSATILTFISMNATASVYVMCHTNSETIAHSDSFQSVSAIYTTHIKNTTGKTGDYHVQDRLDLDDKIVYNNIRIINLKPGEEFHESYTYTYQAKFNKKHKYNAPCMLNVYGHEEGFISGGGYVNVI